MGIVYEFAEGSTVVIKDGFENAGMDAVYVGRDLCHSRMSVIGCPEDCGEGCRASVLTEALKVADAPKMVNITAAQLADWLMNGASEEDGRNG